MRLARAQFICRTTLCSSENVLPSRICIRSVNVFPFRPYSQSSTSPAVPPPRPTDSTSKSSGLNYQLHPNGRPPLSATSRIASTTAETAASASVEQSPIVAEYRTPLRVKSSNTPQVIRDTAKVVYKGPLSKAVRCLKAFSISSLILTTSVTPFLLTMEASVPMIARVSMVTAALGATFLSTGLVHYFLTPYVVRATYMSISHQLNLENFSLFARRKNNIVNVDDLHRLDGDGFRMHVNLKNEADGKVWFIHSEPEVSKEFWETLDSPKGGYKDLSGKSVTFKAKVGDNPGARMFEDIQLEKQSTT